MAKGIDYAFLPHPSISAIRADGDAFVCRYISSDARNDANGKNILPAEKTALLGAGLHLVMVCEEWAANRMLAGHAAGVADAQHADTVVKALGMTGMPIYFACDFDASESQQTAINAYLEGAADIIGRARVGIYGGYWPVKRALDAGKARYAWQTYAWSGGQWDSRAQLRQVLNGVRIGGADCDRDTSMAADYGQWPRYVPPPPSPLVEWTYAAPTGLKVAAGYTTFRATWVAPPLAGHPAPAGYWVYVLDGVTKRIVPSYPRTYVQSGYQGGGLVRHHPYILRVVTVGANGTHVRPATFAQATFTTG